MLFRCRIAIPLFPPHASVCVPACLQIVEDAVQVPVTLVQWMLRFATLLPLLLFALMSYGVASLFKKQAACDRIRKNALATAKRIEYVSVDVTVL